jgi:hypothetical protein
MMKIRLWLLICLSFMVAACASAPSQPLPVGTLTLAQVAHVATKDEMARGVKVDDTSLLVPPYLLKRCALEAGSLESGDLAVMRMYVSWTSHVPQSSLWWVVVPKGMVVTPGDFVEVELKSGVGNERCPSIARVRSLSTASGECGYERNERSGVGAALGSFADTVHAIGGAEGGSPGSASIYCKGLEQESWMKDPAGPYDAIVWRRVPGVGYVAGPDSRIQRNGFSLLPPSGRGWMVAPTGQYGATWGKLLSDSKGNRSTVTVMASAGQYKDRKVDLRTPAGLRATAEYTVNGDGASDRFRVVEAKYSDVYQSTVLTALTSTTRPRTGATRCRGTQVQCWCWRFAARSADTRAMRSGASTPSSPTATPRIRFRWSTTRCATRSNIAWTACS